MRPGRVSRSHGLLRAARDARWLRCRQSPWLRHVSLLRLAIARPERRSRRPRIERHALAPLLALIAVLTTGCSSLEGTGDKGYISQDGSVVEVPVAERERPIEVTADDLDGNEISLADHRGRVVVVNVWGSWCAPCGVEQPDLNAASEETSGVADFIGVNIRDSSADSALSFVRSYDVPYPSFYDPDSKALLNFSEVMPVRSPPTTFVLDKEGRIAAAIFGALPSVGTLVTLVEDVDAETEGTTSG